jgi:hypothetical protein
MKSAEALVKRYRETIATIPAEIRKLVNRSGRLSESILLDLILNPQDQKNIDINFQKQKENVTKKENASKF